MFYISEKAPMSPLSEAESLDSAMESGGDIVDMYFQHFGVKGMRWGVRKSRDSSSGSESSEVFGEKSEGSSRNYKKAAIIAGSALGIAAIAVGGVYLANKAGMSISDLRRSTKPETLANGQKMAKAFAKEPTGIVFASRGKEHGTTFLQFGGLPDPLGEYDRAGFNFGEVPTGTMRRYGDRKEKIAINFLDPEGRRDAASRPIFHEVILPEGLASGIDDFDAAVSKVWPMLKDQADVMYALGRRERFPHTP